MFRRSILRFEAVVKASVQGRVAVAVLNRPKALNALNEQLVSELGEAVSKFDADQNVGCIVITGEGDKAFCGGADIKQMAPMDFSQVYTQQLFGDLNKVRNCRTPIIAAVNGFALGGGCELAMLCDIIYASSKAKFGQPEIKLGTIPGIGGTQNLTKLIGKSRAMEWCLSGDFYTADDALKAGLVAKVFAPEELLPESMKMAEKIAAYSKITSQLAKSAVNQALELGISDGLEFEKRIFQSTFGTKDKMEGMAAFVEKRAPSWSHA